MIGVKCTLHEPAHQEEHDVSMSLRSRVDTYDMLTYPQNRIMECIDPHYICRLTLIIVSWKVSIPSIHIDLLKSCHERCLSQLSQLSELAYQKISRSSGALLAPDGLTALNDFPCMRRPVVLPK